MKKIGVLILVAALVVTMIFPMKASADLDLLNDKSVQQGCHSVDAKTPLLGSVPYTNNAISVILYENNSDTLMYAYNVDEQLYPSSFVKILTCLIAVEKGNLTEEVTVRQDILNTIPSDAVSVNLCAEEVISLEDLLYCMMVQSANDAAAVIADHISGSQEKFVAEMNAYAERLGCTGTKFTNAHGLHHPEQVTTARDTARILGAAMKNEAFAEIFNTAFYTVAATNKSAARSLETSNHLINDKEYAIYFDQRVTGGRTGVTDDGYRCIAAAAEEDGLQMISVVMGTHSTFDEVTHLYKLIGGFMETRELLDMGFAGYQEARILYDGQILKQQAVANGKSDVVLGCLTNRATILPAGVDNDDLIYRYDDVPGAFEAPVQKGDIMSHVEIWYGSVCLAYVELVAMNDVESVFQQLPEQEVPGDVSGDDAGGKVVLWIVVGALAAVVIFVLGSVVLKRIRLATARRRSRKYRRSRRRSR